MVFQTVLDVALLEGENRLGKKQESNLSFKVVWEFCILEEREMHTATDLIRGRTRIRLLKSLATRKPFQDRANLNA